MFSIVHHFQADVAFGAESPILLFCSRIERSLRRLRIDYEGWI